jgi:hypothetical protein
MLSLRRKINSGMKSYRKILFSILTAMICTIALAADQECEELQPLSMTAVPGYPHVS